jgi:predicted AlkP superfamily phosphohydrolase/phosphomutase
MRFFKRTKSKRICIIGLDGVPFSLLEDMAQKEIMPFTSKLIQSGYLHKMKASLPEISAVSWTDFMTGTNSGEHGIFGFTDLKKNSYDLRFPNFLDVKKQTIWDILGQRKKRSIIINQPSTYPARQIHGLLVSGFVAIELTKAIYPLSLKAALEQMDYKIDIDTMRSREDHDFLWKELSETLSGRIRLFDMFWKESWDYFEIVITGTDRLHHYLWDAYNNDNHPYHHKFGEYYSQIDKTIEKIYRAFLKLTGSDDGFYLLSDHGFTQIEQEVYLNAWLEKEGYLQFNSPSPKDLNEIHPNSLAFAMDPSRIYLHMTDKYPGGCVSEPQKEEIKGEIKYKLKKLEQEGKPVVREVYDTQEIYSGPNIMMGPDLIVVPEYGYDMKGSIKKKETFGRTVLQGMHTWDDAFFWANEEKGKDLHISGLAEIILEELS